MKKAYFLSDLHLGDAESSRSRDREQRVVSFLESIKDDCEALFLVGDILDYWFEYRTVVPRGYLRFFGALTRLADAGVKITWFIGNHDIWMFDYLRDEIGINVIDGHQIIDLYGSRFFISHGDGLGKLPPAFRFIRSLFRNPLCQKLYAAVHPRWTIPFAHRWSAHSRLHDVPAPDYHPQTDPLVIFARETLAADPSINYFIFGHRHVMLQEPISTTCQIIILGDWISHFSYAVFDGKTLSLRQYKL